MKMQRREFMAAAAAIAAVPARAATALDDVPVIDCHVHLFDGNRPQGAPYMGSRYYQEEYGKAALPSIYEKVARPAGVVGAIEIDASPWVEDNLWVLETIQPATIMVGTVGNLEPQKPEFKDYLERYARNPLYRGIRYGNVWGYDIAGQADNPVFIEGLKLLVEHDLVLDTANPRLDLLHAVVKVTDKVPDLRIVLDHIPQFNVTPENRAEFDAVMKEIAQRPNVFGKLSEVAHPERPAGRPAAPDPNAPLPPVPPVDLKLASHKAWLDTLMGYFGEDRVVFGSDWPNAVGTTITQNVQLMREYFAGRGHAAAEKYFWKNSVRAYKWAKRAANQPG
jgi:predicted TIM-barrel fold metal-dependent hydrolase